MFLLLYFIYLFSHNFLYCFYIIFIFIFYFSFLLYITLSIVHIYFVDRKEKFVCDVCIFVFHVRLICS
jgi:hypothetical protein